MPPTETTRRAFLGTVAALAGIGLMTSFAAPAAATAPSTAWQLVARSDCRCRACRVHAANKVFATEAAALAGRAHPGCRCAPVALELPATAYVNLFRTATSVDRRTSGITAQLAMTGPISNSPVATAEPQTPAAAQTPPAASNRPSVAPPAVVRGDAHVPVSSGTESATTARSHRGQEVGQNKAAHAKTSARGIDAEDWWIPVPILAVAAAVGGLVWLRQRDTVKPHNATAAVVDDAGTEPSARPVSHD
jgi:hypothetical protein